MKSNNFIRTSIYCFCLILIFLGSQTEAVQNPVIIGQVQPLLTKMPTMGLKIIGTDNKGKSYTTVTDASGKFTLKGLPFNSTIQISLSNNSVIAENKTIYTGNKYDQIKLN